MSSPWGKIENVQNVNFAEIMSEEYAREMQNKEIKKNEKLLQDRLKNATKIREKEAAPSPVVGEECEASLWVEDCVGAAGGSVAKCSYANAVKIPTDVGKVRAPAVDSDDEWEDCSKLLDNPDYALAEGCPIPDFIIDVLRKDAGEMGCDSDALIAQMMQSQFDHEYNEEVKRIEKKRNQGSKVSVSLNKFLRDGDMEFLADDEDEEEYEDSEKRDWDRFETNEKLFETIPKCGFKLDKDGEMITKHDDQICGVRNACKVMSFPPEFPTGDGAGFEMKLSNQVYNQLKTYSRKNKKSKMHDRKENVATAEMGVDAPTRLLLYKLINNQILEQINGIVSTGKEAVILHGSPDPNYTGELLLPKECAIKIFKTTLNEFKQRDRYIKDDYRFKDRFSKQNNRVIINMWAEKEMHNMMRMRDAGINCPDVVVLKKHVLVMSFIGDNHNAAPKLKDARLSDSELSIAYEEILEMMYKLYNVAKLVHADLSEYNILWHDDKCWFIDVAQSVEPDHPSALEFLMRDCDNIVTFFRKRGLPNIFTKEQLFEHITSLNVDKHNAAMLERIHTRGASIKEATAPNQDDVPDEFKPLSYPFDTAWEKSQEDRRAAKNEEQAAAADIEITDALKVLGVSCGGNEITVKANTKTTACKN